MTTESSEPQRPNSEPSPGESGEPRVRFVDEPLPTEAERRAQWEAFACVLRRIAGREG